MRGIRRWWAVLAGAAIALVVCAFSLHRARTPATFVIQPTPTTLPADGFTTIELRLHSSTGRDLRGLRVEIDDPHREELDSVVVSGDSAVISLRTGVLPGETKLHFAGS